jgi:glycosyltransferase involved in cell wall biosynthesis
MSAPAAPDASPVVEVVVPVYNEAHVLRRSVERLHRYLNDSFPFSWRITVVDNASTDGTLAIASELAAELPGVRVLHLDQKGRGRALRTAWLASDADVATYMDVDLSTGLNALLPLVAPLLSGHSDLSIGSRLAPAAAVARGPQREFISRVYNFMLRVVFLNRFGDAQCGFKAIRTDIGRILLPKVRDDAWFFDTELLLLAEHNGLRVHEVPVDWVDDPDTRVHIRSTVSQDISGMSRMMRTFVAGHGKVELGEHARPGVTDDMGRQFVGFAFVGVASTLASLLLFLWLRPSVGAIWANLIALTATTIVNMWANRRYTFGQHGRSDRSRQYIGALVVWLLGAALSTFALGMVVLAKGSDAMEVVVLLAAWSLMAVVRFALLRSWVFRRRTTPIGVERTRLKSPR